MPYSFCDTIPDKSVCEKVPQDALVEIHVWEAFTVNRTISYAGFLAEHSFDGTEVMLEKLPHGRACYRFEAEQWSNWVKPFLIRNSIPVSIRMVNVYQPTFNLKEYEPLK